MKRGAVWEEPADAAAKGARRPTGRDGLTLVAPGSYLARVRAVGLKVLKNRLSEYVRLAAGGETVLVTDRDRVVAELNSPAASRGEQLTDAHLAALVREGILRPPLVPRGTVPPRKPVGPTDELLRELDEDRRDR